jgi:hypothetical protein
MALVQLSYHMLPWLLGWLHSGITDGEVCPLYLTQHHTKQMYGGVEVYDQLHNLDTLPPRRDLYPQDRR